ncbi:MAG: uncharacterized protein KVP18_000508 [Porospora cf. gigantea A]|uniref:uncharacterized protein n=1 Tax=Porospora cf. gigantea A TaxID=2853593 RepID=UPI003559E5EB|nr:MAG: hypothetical protein KVP18_000508 [Porospora cf. gigantea A]
MRNDYQSLSGSKLDINHILAPLGVGLVVGFAFTKSGAYLPTIIHGCAVLKNQLLSKVLLSAAGASMAFQSLLQLADKSKYTWSRVGHGNGVMYSALGGILLGAGMSLAQSDPLICWIQAGAGIQTALWTGVGALLAVVCWGFLSDHLCKDPVRLEKSYLDDALKNCDYWMMALPLSLVFLGVCVLLETQVASWEDEAPSGWVTNSDNAWIPDPRVAFWSPYIAGIVIGLAQLPLRAILGKHVTGFASFISPVSIVVHKGVGDGCNQKVPRWFQATSGAQGLWTLIFALSCGVGAIIASQSTGTFANESGVGPLWTIIGGVCGMVGCMMAGGDILSIFVSGISDLHIDSFVAAISTVAGGYGCGFFLDAINVKVE